MLSSQRVVVIGAGIGGLVAALELARRGCEVTVLERATAPGGKMRVVEVAGRAIDAGPTVLTMRWVFDEIFADAGAFAFRTRRDEAGRDPGSSCLERRRAARSLCRRDTFGDSDRHICGGCRGKALPRVLRARPFDLRDAQEAIHPLRAAQSVLAHLRSGPCAGLQIFGESRRFLRFGTNSAPTSTIRDCASCSAAMRHTAAPRRLKLPRH